MVVVVDEDVAKYWQENFFKQAGVVVGIGDHTIVAAFPTPATESESHDPEWVAEHAMQVSRMLVGGLHVRGVYLLETSEKWSEYPATFHPNHLASLIVDRNFDFLNKCTLAIATALEESGNQYHIQYGLLQLLVAPDNTVTFRYLCKRVNQNNNEQEIDVKTQPNTLKQLHTLTCTFALSLTIPLPKDTQKLVQNSLQPFVDSSVTYLASHLKKTIAIINGKSYSLSPLSPSPPSSSATPLSKLGPSLQHTVPLFAPVLGNICSEEYKKGKGGIGRFVQVKGNIVGVAVGSAESSLEDTLDYLAGDNTCKRLLRVLRKSSSNNARILFVLAMLCATLRTRLNLLCETDSPAPELPSRIVARVPISRSRPAAHNSILLCDYVTSDESTRETEERFQALLALTLPKTTNVDGIATGLILREDSTPLVQQQIPAQKLQAPSPQSNSDNAQSQTVVANNQQKSFFLPIAVAVVVAIVGVVILLMQK